MTSEDPPGNRPPATRHIYGPRPIGALVPVVARPTFRRRAPAAAQVMADWPTLVGPQLAAVTAPRRLAGGTLTIACAGPVALELQHLSGQLIERLRFVQEMVTDTSAPPRPARAADPAMVARTQREVACVPEGALREALIRLGVTLKAQK